MRSVRIKGNPPDGIGGIQRLTSLARRVTLVTTVNGVKITDYGGRAKICGILRGNNDCSNGLMMKDARMRMQSDLLKHKQSRLRCPSDVVWDIARGSPESD